MLYPSTFLVTPIKDEDFAERIKDIHTLLASYETTGSIKAYDGLSLKYYYYLCEKSIGTIVIIHGFTEFALKYEEIIYYFLEAGYNVFIYDQRSHGHSGSAIEDRRYNHVEDFSEYAKDLNSIMEKVVRPTVNDSPISIFCHSMGGAVSLMYFHDFKPDFLHKAVFSSPMVIPRMWKNIPIPIVEYSIKKSAKEDGWNAPFAHTSHFNPHPEYSASHDCSPARFNQNLALRLSDTNFQNSGSTNRWLWECLRIRKYMPKKDYLSVISQDILIMAAGQDTVVYASVYKKLHKYLQKSRVSFYPNSKHSIYNSDDETLVRYWKEIFEFLKEP